jgi:hypothetical protein
MSSNHNSRSSNSTSFVGPASVNGRLRSLLRPCRRRAEEAKQQEEEEAKKREEEEAAAAAAALAGVSLEAETATSARDATRVPAGTDDTEREDSLLGSSIDVRATSSVAQVRLSVLGQWSSRPLLRRTSSVEVGLGFLIAAALLVG